ncbi:MAG TPA: hypothetical protein VFU05_09355 [Cyclobacteriaceae bacterium]|nr:hypothetical protein [Cyclobacteriaceae bacterium]
MNYSAINEPYMGTVQDINDTGKIFTGSGIQKKKYIVTFEEGYRAEYCPPALQQLNFKRGDIIEFKIIHRNGKGDEIEVIGVTGALGQVAPALKGAMNIGGANSMVGHPAVVALTVSKDMAMQNGWTWEVMLEKADEAMKWLIDRRDLEQYNF